MGERSVAAWRGLQVVAANSILGAAAFGEPCAASSELIYSDGRRETVQETRRDARGRWTATIEGLSLIHI